MEQTTVRRRFFAILLLLLVVGGGIVCINAATVSFHQSAKRFYCPSTRSVPNKLLDISLIKGDNVPKYILLDPHYTAGQLCTLTRNNDEFKPIHIPIARAFDDNPLWNKSAGRFVSSTEVTCGEAATDGPSGSGYLQGETLCQIKLDPLGLTDDGYFLTLFDVTDQMPVADAAGKKTFHSEPAIVANFLSRVTFGPSE